MASVPEPIVSAVGSDPAPIPRRGSEAPRLRIDPSKASTPLSTPALLMLAWGLASFVLLTRFLRSIRATRRLIRESRPVPDGLGWFRVDFEAFRRTAGVRS